MNPKAGDERSSADTGTSSADTEASTRTSNSAVTISASINAAPSGRQFAGPASASTELMMPMTGMSAAAGTATRIPFNRARPKIGSSTALSHGSMVASISTGSSPHAVAYDFTAERP